MRYKKPIIFSLMTVLAALAGGFLWLFNVGALEYDLPKNPLKFHDVKMSSATSVVDANGRLIDYWYGDNLRLYRPLSQIDPWLKTLVVFLEDAKFFSHQGLDLEEIKKSFQENLEKKKVKRGASTITQQVAKNLFLDQKRSILRKLFEVPWALRLEKDFTKSQILELYLNLIEWGPGIYGAEAAARHYFDRPASLLSPGQAMYLALIIPSPVRFDLLGNPRSARNVQARKFALIDRLVGEKKITAQRGEELRNTEFGLIKPEAQGRNYPLSHEGSYVGNRYRKDPLLKELEKNLRPRARTRFGKVQLSLNDVVHNEINAMELEDAEAPVTRFLLFTQENRIRAFRKVPSGKGLRGLSQWLQTNGTSFEVLETDQVNWANLLL